MPVMACMDRDCPYKKGDLTESVGLKMMKMHVAAKHRAPVVKSEDGGEAKTGTPKAPGSPGRHHR